ncbi:MAG: hypothetical protein MJ120_00070 [Clostridia bacterium]|nr:hypothetical protein [Clostridia bacterium]
MKNKEFEKLRKDLILLDFKDFKIRTSVYDNFRFKVVELTAEQKESLRNSILKQFTECKTILYKDASIAVDDYIRASRQSDVERMERALTNMILPFCVIFNLDMLNDFAKYLAEQKKKAV